jgi:hypothetical protein
MHAETVNAPAEPVSAPAPDACSCGETEGTLAEPPRSHAEIAHQHGGSRGPLRRHPHPRTGNPRALHPGRASTHTKTANAHTRTAEPHARAARAYPTVTQLHAGTGSDTRATQTHARTNLARGRGTRAVRLLEAVARARQTEARSPNPPARTRKSRNSMQQPGVTHGRPAPHACRNPGRAASAERRHPCRPLRWLPAGTRSGGRAGKMPAERPAQGAFGREAPELRVESESILPTLGA